MTHKGDIPCGRIAMDELSGQDRATVKKIMGLETARGSTGDDPGNVF